MRDNKLKEILKDVFGHSGFRFDQEKIIHSVLEKMDVLAIMPTGGGKSICYQIPALFSEGLTIIVSPLISLMHDQVLNLKENGIEACYLNSSQEYEERQKAERKIESKKVKIVYVSPEGLLSGNLLRFLQRFEISLIAIDEAHCVSQWGHEFRKDYTRLGELKEYFPDTPVLALTATADAKTRKDIASQLRLNDPQTFVSSFDRPNIKYSIYERENELKQLDRFIREFHESDTGIVYCLSRRKVEKTAAELVNLGHKAISYHAGLSSNERAQAQEAFNCEEKIIVVATIAFGMGIDRPDVRFVAHLDLPKSVESYYQETGRAGRDGAPANAWMVYGLQDVIKLSQMIETTDAGDTYKKVARFKLDSMLSLCETIQCRREYLLNYFEEESAKFCGACDSCLNPAEDWDATIDAQKVLSVIFKTGQCFGTGHIIDVLRESKNTKIIERGHDELSVYGIGKDQPKSHWSALIRQLLCTKYIAVKNWEYRSLCLSSKSGEILRGETVFKIRKRKLKVSQKVKNSLIEANHNRPELFEELRQLRRDLADENNVPPYVIFADKTLHDMCQIMPRNRAEFLMVNGVGESKCEKYSAAFIGKIKEYC